MEAEVQQILDLQDYVSMYISFVHCRNP